MVKMSHLFGKADSPKRVAYTVSDDWTSARRGNKKLRLCALGTALDRPRETIPSTFNQKVEAVISLGTGLGRPRETIPSTFDQQLEAAIGSGTNWVEVARRLPKPRTSQALDVPKPLNPQLVVRPPEWPSPDPANSSGAISDYEMQILLLEQQNKKRLLMARDSPILDNDISDLASPTTGQSDRTIFTGEAYRRIYPITPGQGNRNGTPSVLGEKDRDGFPLVPGEEHRNVYPTTPGQRDRDRSSPTFIQDMRESRNVQTIQPHSSHPAHALMSQQEQIKMYRRAPGRYGSPPSPNLASATEQLDANSYLQSEAYRRRRQKQEQRYLQQLNRKYEPLTQQQPPSGPPQILSMREQARMEAEEAERDMRTKEQHEQKMRFRRLRTIITETRMV
jgi:hypothetical protein